MSSASEQRPHARLLTRADCSLCERVSPLLERLVSEGLMTLERVDITHEPALAAQYGTRIPVLLLSTGHCFEGRISEYRLRKTLATRSSPNAN